MKRIVSIILVIMMVFVVSVACGDGKGRIEFAEQVEENCAILMKAYRDFYKKNPSGFSDTHLIAMYDYYKMYVNARSLHTAELSMNLGEMGESLIQKDMVKLSSDVAIMIETNWNKWLNGDYEREKIIDMIIRFIDGSLEAIEGV